LHPPALVASPPGEHAQTPLVVDLDGTLIRTDMLHESAVRLFRTSPLSALQIPLWLTRGKAAMKQWLAAKTPFDASVLPYNEQLLTWLREQRQSGRSLILCTASDLRPARDIAAHCGLFDEVIASDGMVNRTGQQKADTLTARFGTAGFDYAGNASADLPVWRVARRGIVVNATPEIVARARDACVIEQVFPPERPHLATWCSALRVHHWAKNVLLFVALFAAHQMGDIHAWGSLVMAFAAFSLCASSVYIANDLMDLEHDRRHPRKRMRPFAAGTLPVAQGVLLILLLALASLALSISVGPAFVAWLSTYFALTWLYSCWLKRVVLIDCLTLATLHMLRVIAGAAVIGVPMSFWLLAFSFFLFLSLAFVKRYAELHQQRSAGETEAHGRGYVSTDAPMIQLFGVVSGYCAVLVLALYLNSEAIVRLYKTPELVWIAVPVTLFWISWIWLRAFRGEMHDDPLVFAFRDKVSLLCAALFGMALVLGSQTLPW
jgi:4-hydroxybenzoate polyprenyltransferase/phosphoserine phosphatase